VERYKCKALHIAYQQHVFLNNDLTYHIFHRYHRYDMLNRYLGIHVIGEG